MYRTLVNLPKKPSPQNGWDAAAMLLERWLDQRGRVDTLLEEVRLSGEDRTRCQHLLFGAIRHLSLLDGLIQARVARQPRSRLRAVLLLAGFELLEGRAKAPAVVVDHAVGRGKQLVSAAEARLVNAVLRKLADDLAARAGKAPGTPGTGAGPAELAENFSHPEWLVKRWLGQFGVEATQKLLAWNQEPAPVYARGLNGWKPAGTAVAVGTPAEGAPAFAQTSWEGFYRVGPGHWAEVERLLGEGKMYLQDPATRLAPEILAVGKGETVLDCCAAPGGKSLMLAEVIAGHPAPAGKTNRLVALDRPGQRLERLQENLAKVTAVDVAIVQSDLLQATPGLFEELNLPVMYDAVLLDVPCSNTGVMRHRVDAKWRLREEDFARHAARQLDLLFAAARLVAPRGRLVYSTCSLEKEENEGVVAKFIRKRGKDFVKEGHILSRPWETGHDGAGVFLLTKRH